MARIQNEVDIVAKEQENILIITMKGRLDAITTASAEEKLFDYIKQGNYYLLLDFRGIEYLSSAGMRMLLSCLKKLQPYSGKMVLFGIVPNVMDVLKMSGFDRLLTIAKDQEEGLHLVQSSIST